MTSLAVCGPAGRGLGAGADLPDGSPCADINLLGGLPFTDTGDTTMSEYHCNPIANDFDPGIVD